MNVSVNTYSQFLYGNNEKKMQSMNPVNGGALKRAVFFDRDGVVNVSPGAGYVTRVEDFYLMPGFPEVLRYVKGRGYLAVIITNQRCVATGLLAAEELERIHESLRSCLRDDWRIDVDDIYYCPHDRNDGCGCRKPLPGMLLDAAKKHSIDLSRSWMIGDQSRDIAAGRTAGCKTIIVGDEVAYRESGADYCVSSVEELVGFLKDISI